MQVKTLPHSFETGRLFIHSSRPADAPALHAAIAESLPELRPWMAWAAHPAGLDELARLQVQAQDDFQAGRAFRYLLFLRPGAELVGTCGLKTTDWEVPSFDIGYWVRTSAAGHGYIHEALAALCDLAFEQLAACRLQILVDTLNERSANVARRAGFELEGIRRCDARDHLSGELRDTYVFSRVRR